MSRIQTAKEPVDLLDQCRIGVEGKDVLLIFFAVRDALFQNDPKQVVKGLLNDSTVLDWKRLIMLEIVFELNAQVNQLRNTGHNPNDMATDSFNRKRLESAIAALNAISVTDLSLLSDEQKEKITAISLEQLEYTFIDISLGDPPILIAESAADFLVKLAKAPKDRDSSDISLYIADQMLELLKSPSLIITPQLSDQRLAVLASIFNLAY
jgi:hypothetical protein